MYYLCNYFKKHNELKKLNIIMWELSYLEWWFLCNKMMLTEGCSSFQKQFNPLWNVEFRIPKKAKEQLT